MKIEIKTQEEFNKLNSLITNSTDDIIDIEINEGIFEFTNNHICLENINNPNLSILIKGNNTTIISGKITTDFNPLSALIDTTVNKTEKTNLFTKIINWFKYLFKKKKIKPERLSIWPEEFKSATQLIEVLNNNKECCLYCDIDEQCDCENVYINVLQWYTSNYYKVNKIEKGKIFFTCTDLTYNEARQGYFINGDYLFGKIYPRYRLCNISEDDVATIKSYKTKLPYGYNSFKTCSEECFITFSNCKFKSIIIKDLNFNGNAYLNKKSLFYFLNTDSTNIQIENCNFTNIYSTCIYNLNTNKLNVFNCNFTNIYNSCILSRDSNDTSIRSCTFKNVGLNHKNVFAIRVNGENSLVTNNEFSNFGYGAIEIGTWYGAVKNTTNTATVLFNNIHDSYTPLMDSGAIYLFTNNDNVKIGYNYINNYTGAYYNRGIFGDDGAKSFTLYNNVILNCSNSYSIDSRRVLSVEKEHYSSSNTEKVNIDNTIKNNYFDGPIRFEGRGDKANCSFLENYSNKSSKNIFNYIDNFDEITILDSSEFNRKCNEIKTIIKNGVLD
jgi:hypothetical protein